MCDGGAGQAYEESLNGATMSALGHVRLVHIKKRLAPETLYGRTDPLNEEGLDPLWALHVHMHRCYCQGVVHVTD